MMPKLRTLFCLYNVKFQDVLSRLSAYRTSRKKTAQILESSSQSLNADHNIKVDSKSSKSSILNCNVNKVKESGQIKVEEKNESATARVRLKRRGLGTLWIRKCFSDAFRLLSHLRQLERQ